MVGSAKTNDRDKLDHPVGRGRLPSWIRSRLTCNAQNSLVKKAISQSHLHTVCESALCPNRSECFGQGTATVLIMGDICTRNCRFCAIQSGTPTPLDPDEPLRLAQLAQELRLKHVVITSVTRDDLKDGGASAFARCIAALKELPGVTVEVLTPDFQGKLSSLATVLEQRPDVFNHNLETVKRLQPFIRPQASYTRSLKILRSASADAARVKSGIMVGLGETDEELSDTLMDIYETGCRYLTIGQYLAPTKRHISVKRYLHPKKFDELRDESLKIGFKAVASGPMVRSSYQAERMLTAT